MPPKKGISTKKSTSACIVIANTSKVNSDYTISSAEN